MVLQRKGIKYIRSWNGEIRSSVGVMNDITKEGDTWAENRRNFMLNQTCVFFKWPIDIWKDVQKPLIIREMQIKTTSHWSESEVKSLSHVRLFATPWTAAYQTPPSMGFSRQEYWSGVPFPSPTLVRMAMIKMSTKNKHWGEHEEKRNFLHCWWEFGSQLPR